MRVVYTCNKLLDANKGVLFHYIYFEIFYLLELQPPPPFHKLQAL